MKLTRRKALAGIGIGAIAGGAVFGSGAFTQTALDRSSTLVVSDDADGLLAIEPGPGASGDADGADADSSAEVNEVDEDNNTHYEIKFGDDDDGGVNVDGVTVFRDVLEITNNGEQDAYVLVAGSSEDDDTRRGRARVLANDESMENFADGKSAFDYGDEVTDISVEGDFEYDDEDRFGIRTDPTDEYDTGPVTVDSGDSIYVTYEFETKSSTRSGEFEGEFRLKAFSTDVYDEADVDDQEVFQDDDIDPADIV